MKCKKSVKDFLKLSTDKALDLLKSESFDHKTLIDFLKHHNSKVRDFIKNLLLKKVFPHKFYYPILIKPAENSNCVERDLSYKIAA